MEEISNGYMTVLPNEGTPERASSDRIIVKIQHTDPSKEPLPGDVVEITYNGEILETYEYMQSHIVTNEDGIIYWITTLF